MANLTQKVEQFFNQQLKIYTAINRTNFLGAVFYAVDKNYKLSTSRIPSVFDEALWGAVGIHYEKEFIDPNVRDYLEVFMVDTDGNIEKEVHINDFEILIEGFSFMLKRASSSNKIGLKDLGYDLISGFSKNIVELVSFMKEEQEKTNLVNVEKLEDEIFNVISDSFNDISGFIYGIDNLIQNKYSFIHENKREKEKFAKTLMHVCSNLGLQCSYENLELPLYNCPYNVEMLIQRAYFKNKPYYKFMFEDKMNFMPVLVSRLYEDYYCEDKTALSVTGTKRYCWSASTIQETPNQVSQITRKGLKIHLCSTPGPSHKEQYNDKYDKFYESTCDVYLVREFTSDLEFEDFIGQLIRNDNSEIVFFANENDCFANKNGYVLQKDDYFTAGYFRISFDFDFYKADIDNYKEIADRLYCKLRKEVVNERTHLEFHDDYDF